jgi:hypothetical protein
MKRMPDSPKNRGKRDCIASTLKTLRGSTPQQGYVRVERNVWQRLRLSPILRRSNAVLLKARFHHAIA